jgi:hypothetical protein
MGQEPREIPPGSLWRHERLGTVAIYEVLRIDGDIVEVKVREAPGLPVDAVIRITLASLDAMVCIEGQPGSRLSAS